MGMLAVNENSLTSVANAIRTAGGTQAELTFPAGFVSAIEAISGGGGGGGITPITGSVTPSAENTAISFGQTVSKYVFIIEMDSTSKASLIASGTSGNRLYYGMFLYPVPEINSKSHSKVIYYGRYNASSDSVSFSEQNLSAASDTGITIKAYSLETSSAGSLILGYKYNWMAIPLE